MNLIDQGEDLLKFLDKYNKPIGTIGGLWGAYNRQTMAKDNYKLQKQDYYYKKRLSERNIRRQEEAERALQEGFENSISGKKV